MQYRYLEGWRGDAVALLAGVAFCLAFAPFRYHSLALVCVAAFFLSVENGSDRRACWRGWLFGLGLFGAGVSWIQVSIHQFGLPVLAFSVSATVVFVAFVALFPAMAVKVYRACRVPQGCWGQAVQFAGAWVLTEWTRSWIFTGFPWLSLGYSQTLAPLSGYAPLIGVFGVSLLLVITAVLLIGCLRSTCRARLALAIAGVWILGWTLQSYAWTQPAGESFPVALIQGNIPQSMKWSPSERDTTLRRYVELTRSEWGKVAFIVWPETAVPALYAQARAFLDELQSLAGKHGTDLLVGIPYQDPSSSQYFNSAVALGAAPGVYHKQHLVPFGEFMPFKPVLGPLLNFLEIPMSDFSSGPPDQSLLRLGGHAVGIAICYEDVFGEEVIRSLPQAEVLINMSNDAWFGDSLAPHQHLEMAQMRAIESGRYMLRSTNTGVTAGIDQTGQVVAQLPTFVPRALHAEARAYSGLTPYARVGNWPAVIVTVVIVLQALLRRFRLMKHAD